MKLLKYFGLYSEKEVELLLNELDTHKKNLEEKLELTNRENRQLKSYQKYLEENLGTLSKENRDLKCKMRKERHEEVRQIKAIAKKSKKYRVKKKCETRLLKIRLGR